jgi:hypothetical protein
VLALGRRRHREVLAGLAGFALLLGFYLLWRQTEAFGFLRSTTPAHMRGTGASLSHLTENAKSLFHWWLGRRHVAAWSQGFAAFADLAPARQILLAVLNLGLVAWLARGLRVPPAAAAESFPKSRLLAFAASAFACASVPALLGYVESRLLVLPAIPALALLARVGVEAKGAPWLRPTALVLFFAALFADQGTNHSWRQSALAYRDILAHLREHRADWVDRDYLIFDSRAFRKGRDPDPIRALAFQGNASFFRGSGLRELIWLAGRRWPLAKGRLDVEYAAEYRDDGILLHGRYGAAQDPLFVPRENAYLLPLDQVVWPRE